MSPTRTSRCALKRGLAAPCDIITTAGQEPATEPAPMQGAAFMSTSDRANSARGVDSALFLYSHWIQIGVSRQEVAEERFSPMSHLIAC